MKCKLALLSLALSSLLGACKPQQVALHYQLDGIDPKEVVLLETQVRVDPDDGRQFAEESATFTKAGPGVGYTVDKIGQDNVFIVRHEAAFGFQFSESFLFTLLPPGGEAASSPPLLITVRADAKDHILGWARELHASFSRGGAIEVPVKSSICGNVYCPTMQECCNGVCSNIKGDDANNCGACGKTCGASEICKDGECSCAGGSACTVGETCCGDGCHSLQSEKFNCGTCGKACVGAETCQGGECKCEGGPACDAGSVCCAGGCVVGNGCSCGGSQCDLPNRCCSDECVNDQDDAAHCGNCNNACPATMGCLNGKCACGDAIVDLKTSNDHCGSCYNACRDGEVCTAGVCKCGGTTCPSGPDYLCCSGGTTGKQCVRSDENNCGACGSSCDTGERCDSGNCKCPDGNGGGSDCEAPFRCCSGKGCVFNDNENCGPYCDMCVSPASCTLDSCEKVCQTTCPPGFFCKEEKCFCPQENNNTCASGEACCQKGCAPIDDQKCPKYASTGCTFEDCTNIPNGKCCPGGAGCAAFKGLCPVF